MLNQLKNTLLDLLFPRQCVGCKKTDTWFCDTCFSHIKPNKTQCCYICRKSSRYGDSCEEHKSRRTLDRLLVTCHYSGNPLLKKALHKLKYERHPEDIQEKLGQLITEYFNKHCTIPTKDLVIIPVPLHKNRLKDRGFNQADLLSFALKEALNGRLTINQQLLSRTKETVSQVQSASRKARLKNLKDAFSLNGKVSPHKTYLLIDDIATSGTTLEECCQVLKDHGARKIWGLVLARN